jgi:DNA modification methylase
VKLHHADTFEFLASCEDDSVEAIITDPPYDFDDPTKMDLLDELQRIARGAVVIFCPPENQFPEPDQYCFWVKPISTKNTKRRYSRFVEMVCLYNYDEGKWNTDRNWSQYVNVFKDHVEGTTTHPYEKPVSLMRRLVLNHTDPGDLILDPFMGSGTTGVAALTAGRDFMGVELEKAFFTLAGKRLEGLEGGVW